MKKGGEQHNPISKKTIMQSKQQTITSTAPTATTIGTKVMATKIIAGVLAVAAIGGTSVAAYNTWFSSTPEKTMGNFARAFNNNDIDAMVECLDDDVQDAYEDVGKTLVNLIGFTPQDIMDEVVDITDLDSKAAMYIEVDDVQYIDGTSAYADCKISFQDEESEETIKLVKEGTKWHIYVDTSDFV